MPVPSSSISTTSFDVAVTTPIVASATVCTIASVMTSLIMSMKHDMSMRLLQIHQTILAERGGALDFRLLVFPVMRCGWNFSVSWPVALLMDTTLHHPIPIHRGVIASSHQVIAPGLLLPLPIRRISSHPGEISLLHLPARPSLCHLPDWQSLLHLPIQPCLSHLSIEPMPHQPSQTSLLLLFALAVPPLW